ncbi:MAG TPA: methylmalonyl-CoA epimerase [Ktedonobacterales bacterium]|jgi:lactoylglutathione lyase/methylmalonyl-CoA/ethylmalonyl-CoA epimerase
MTTLPDFNTADLPQHLITRIDHVAIVVRAIDEALRFYRDLLGMQPSELHVLPDEGVSIAFLPSGGPQGSTIELLEPLDTTGSIAKFLEKRGEGLHHICLETPNIDAALDYLKGRGAVVIDTAPRQAAEGRAIFLHPKGTHGVLLELVQRG